MLLSHVSLIILRMRPTRGGNRPPTPLPPPDALPIWRYRAWWVHDHLPYSEMWFFPKLAAFNLTWRPQPLRSISSYIAPRGMLLRGGKSPSEPVAQRRARYGDFPPLRGIAYP